MTNPKHDSGPRDRFATPEPLQAVEQALAGVRLRRPSVDAADVLAAALESDRRLMPRGPARPIWPALAGAWTLGLAMGVALTTLALSIRSAASRTAPAPSEAAITQFSPASRAEVHTTVSTAGAPEVDHRTGRLPEAIQYEEYLSGRRPISLVGSRQASVAAYIGGGATPPEPFGGDTAGDWSLPEPPRECSLYRVRDSRRMLEDLFGEAG